MGALGMKCWGRGQSSLPATRLQLMLSLCRWRRTSSSRSATASCPRRSEQGRSRFSRCGQGPPMAHRLQLALPMKMAQLKVCRTKLAESILDSERTTVYRRGSSFACAADGLHPVCEHPDPVRHGGHLWRQRLHGLPPLPAELQAGPSAAAPHAARPVRRASMQGRTGAASQGPTATGTQGTQNAW